MSILDRIMGCSKRLPVTRAPAPTGPRKPRRSQPGRSPARLPRRRPSRRAGRGKGTQEPAPDQLGVWLPRRRHVACPADGHRGRWAPGHGRAAGDRSELASASSAAVSPAGTGSSRSRATFMCIWTALGTGRRSRILHAPLAAAPRLGPAGRRGTGRGRGDAQAGGEEAGLLPRPGEDGRRRRRRPAATP